METVGAFRDPGRKLYNCKIFVEVVLKPHLHTYIH